MFAKSLSNLQLSLLNAQQRLHVERLGHDRAYGALVQEWRKDDLLKLRPCVMLATYVDCSIIINSFDNGNIITSFELELDYRVAYARPKNSFIFISLNAAPLSVD